MPKLGQLAMANFNNPKGLVKMGSNRYGESQASGIPNVGVAGAGVKADYVDSLDLFHTMEAYFTWYPKGVPA